MSATECFDCCRRLQTEAQQLKKEIEDVNRQRKVSQLEAGKQLDTLQVGDLMQSSCIC